MECIFFIRLHYTFVNQPKGCCYMINKEFHKNEKEISKEILEIEEAKQDPRKFEVLYNRYHEQIFRYLYARVENKHLASDLVSQVFYKAMLNIENYSFKGVPFASWLYRIAFNEMNMHFRRNSKDRTINIDDTNVYELQEEIEEDTSDSDKQLLIEALASLPDEQVSLIEMRYFEKMSFQQIAQIMGITENNAKVKVYRTLDKIKKGFKVRS